MDCHVAGTVPCLLRDVATAASVPSKRNGWDPPFVVKPLAGLPLIAQTWARNLTNVVYTIGRRSASGGSAAERGVQGLEGQVRALFLAFQDRFGRKVDARERIINFVPEYAAYLMNRLEAGKDGKVS